MQWRNTALYPKLGPIDARCAIPVFLAVLPIAIWKLILASLVVVFFWWLERRNITLIVFFRMVRCALAGPLRRRTTARIWRRRCRN